MRGARWALVVPLAITTLLGPPVVADDNGTAAQQSFDPRRPVERELETSIADGFTLAAVGDCIISHPLSPLLESDPEFAAVIGLLRSADVAFGNFETTAIDMDDTDGYAFRGAGDWGLVSTPEVPADLATMGFDLLSRANNHATDWGIPGMRESDHRLDDAGLVHAGTGEHRAAARAPRYLQTPAGRVALVSMASTYTEGGDAEPPHGRAPGRPGINPLRVSRTIEVTPELMGRLVELKGVYEPSDRATRTQDEGSPETAVGPEDGGTPELPEELTLFGQRFRLGEEPAFRYEMNPVDVEEILAAVRLGKEHADFLVASLHAHETGISPEEPAGFFQEIARAAIDAGADAFVGHGVHRLRPIEIYRGRPIFYSLANFFWSDVQEPVAADFYEEHGDLLDTVIGPGASVTDAEINALVNAQGFSDDKVFQTVVAVSRYEGGRLAELRLHPVDLRYGERLTRSGVPRTADPDTARVILERLRRMSAPYGTGIVIEDGVGVIRPEDG